MYINIFFKNNNHLFAFKQNQIYLKIYNNNNNNNNNYKYNEISISNK